ncbi:MAG TPA: AAA family ATPase, partial [Candidatus Limnocylindrales bacterium]
HGGKIEKYIGDAIMAVFGLPTAHEDDALRAVRAAAGMQAALVSLNRELRQVYGVSLANRTGVNTGEVVANVDPTADQKLATGDAVNVTARLEQAAPENEILIGELTYGLVRDAVMAEPVEPLELKGKTERVVAYRLTGMRERAVEGRVRRDDQEMVGRHDELTRLAGSFATVGAERTCRMVTIVGDAGVGKSRLIREFAADVGQGAQVVRGRCLSYGEGITFWPLVEIVREVADIRDDDPPEVGRSKVTAAATDPDVAARVAAIAGLSSAQFALPELFWAARRLLELLAARRPLVVVVDDVHWAEPAFLDLLEHVVDASIGAPILILCSSRHDLLERRPAWGDRPGSERIVLGPLSDADAGRIVENLLGRAALPDEVRARIVVAAEGNPLFVEQLLEMLLDSGALRFDDGRWIRADESVEVTVPPTIQALLAARLDQLVREERAVLEPASVIGLEFVEPAVTELAPEAIRPTVPSLLDGLGHKRLVRETGADGFRTFRFQHALIRDAAYGSLLKRARATLHERFVGWADRVNADRDRALEFEEILGYHLEQAYRCLRDLGPLDEHAIALGADGARRLAHAGRRAFARGDMHAAANLFGRASALWQPRDGRRLAVLPELGEALMELGEFGPATAALDDARRTAEELADERLASEAGIVQLLVEHYSTDAPDWTRRAIETARAAVAAFERAADETAQAKAWRLLVAANANAGMYGAASAAAEQVVRHARLAGDARQEGRGSSAYAMTALYGPRPVDEAIAACEAIATRVAGDRRTEGVVLGMLAELYAMAGRTDEGRATYRRARGVLEELGQSVLASSVSTNSWRVELEAGDLPGAEVELRRDYAALQAMGETYLLSTVATRLAAVLVRQGRWREAAGVVATARELAASDDVEAQSQWRSVRATLLANEGLAVEAVSLAREAVELLRPTEAPPHLADALADEASVHVALGRSAEAEAPAREALALYRAKGYLPACERMERLLEALQVGLPAHV